MNDKAFFDKACKKAETIVKTIDPGLEVSVFHEKRGQGDRYVLQFKHKTNPKIFWNLVPFVENEDYDGYIENKLPGAIKNVYESKKKE